MNTRIFEYVGKYGAGLVFTNEPDDINFRVMNGSEWKDLGEHDLPESFLFAMGWTGRTFFTIQEWTCE